MQCSCPEKTSFWARRSMEEGDGEVVLLTEVGDGLLLQEVESEQGDLLFRREVPALAWQG